jgi:hypothetical protein
MRDQAHLESHTTILSTVATINAPIKLPPAARPKLMKQQPLKTSTEPSVWQRTERSGKRGENPRRFA